MDYEDIIYTKDSGIGRITINRPGAYNAFRTATLHEMCRALEDAGLDTDIRVIVLRGAGLSSALSETDPLVVGRPSLPVQPLDGSPEAAHSAELVNDWLRQARALLADEHPANSLNLRGFAKDPGFPQFPDVFNLRAGAIAVYPMYRGVARLVGMDVLDAGATLEEEIAARQAIPESLVGQVLGALRTAGFVRSVRGAQGGHELAMEPADVHMDAVVESLDGSISVGACLDNPRLECSGSAGQLRMWEDVRDAILGVLHERTLADLAEREAVSGGRYSI